jgi:hypothetical protein
MRRTFVALAADAGYVVLVLAVVCWGCVEAEAEAEAEAVAAAESV